MNINFIVGHLVKDPEKIKGVEKTLVKMNIAVKENYTDKDGNLPVQYFNVQAWGTIGDNCLKYLKKGSKVAVLGKFQNRCWEDQDGVKHYATEIIASEVEFLTRGKQDGEMA